MFTGQAGQIRNFRQLHVEYFLLDNQYLEKKFIALEELSHCRRKRLYEEEAKLVDHGPLGEYCGNDSAG